MSAVDQLQALSWLLYVLIFGSVLIRTIRRPTPAHIDMTLFFGAVSIVIVVTTVTSRLHLAEPAPLTNDLIGAAAMTLGYLLLRLVRDFSDVPLLWMRTVEVGLVIGIAAIVILPTPLPAPVGLALVGYLVMVIAYDTWAFGRQARRTRGVTRRRMQAVAAGSLCLTLALVVSGFNVAFPEWAGFWSELGPTLGLASGVSYYLGFAPATWLRRAWQEPEIRAFLGRAASLPRLPDTRSIVLELQRGAAAALGAPAANIALWDADAGLLRVFYEPPTAAAGSHAAVSALMGASQPHLNEAMWDLDPVARPVSGQAFLEQRAVLVTDAARADPSNAGLFELFGARAVLSAPISAGDKRLGVMIVYAPRSPVFANSDLELVQLLADQAAVVLESRALIDEAAGVRAREEAARLKEDFLSSAAHDLKTPLTGLVTQAQVLMRRADRDPAAPADRVGLNRLLEQSLRLKNLVLELLDVSRLEHGNILGPRELVDLRELVQVMRAREGDAWARLEIEAPAEVWASVDLTRFEQVLINLAENALKYSPHDSPVLVSVGHRDGRVLLSVRDRGIGIPSGDQPLVFERFHRARNVDDRRFAGMGLGLFIARGVVEQHDGRIWVESTPGVGSVFYVELPPPMSHPRPLEQPAEARAASG